MKILRPAEQQVLTMVPPQRAAYWRRWQRVKEIGRAAKHGLLIVASAAGLFGASSARAAAPSPVSAPALFNAANADQRAGRTGPAILDYERARLLAPRDAAIARNLGVARQKAGLAAPALPGWQRPAHWLSFNELAGLASICLLLFSLLFFGTRFIPASLRGLARGAASSLGVIALLAATLLVLRWPELDRAVIVGEASVARIAPAANAAVSCELKPGEVVQTEASYGEFVRVRATDGRGGWVAAAAVDRIIPAAS